MKCTGTAAHPPRFPGSPIAGVRGTPSESQGRTDGPIGSDQKSINRTRPRLKMLRARFLPFAPLRVGMTVWRGFSAACRAPPFLRRFQTANGKRENSDRLTFALPRRDIRQSAIDNRQWSPAYSRTSAWWRTSTPSTRKRTSSAMLVAWSARRSRARAMNIRLMLCRTVVGSRSIRLINSSYTESRS